MPRFFTQEIDGTRAVITGEDARHITKSLRMQQGEQITLCGLDGYDYLGKIATLGDTVVVDIEQKCENRSEPRCKTVLYMAVPKGDKIELIIQKAVELGVNKIVPMLTRRCVSRPDAKSFAKKLLRYQKIALEAAKQSGRGIVPQVCEMVGFDQALRQAASSCGILCYEQGGVPLGEIITAEQTAVSLLIGSEGGFDECEVEQAKAAGMHIATLGPRILRCETAPLCALSVVMYLTGGLA